MIHHQQIEWNRFGRGTGGHQGDPFRVGAKFPRQHGDNCRQAIGSLTISHSTAGSLFDVV